MPMKYLLLLLPLVSACRPAPEKPFLSNLNVGSEDPLYTTYAAAMERSSFILDQGYEFSFWDTEAPMRMRSKTGGSLGLDLRIGGQLISSPAQMWQSPRISLSYPDMLYYDYKPVDGLNVKGKALVQASNVLVMEWELKNESSVKKEIQLLPLIENEYRPFRAPKKTAGGMHFYHEVYPDGWTLSHNLPFHDTLQNVLLLSEQPDTWASLNARNGLSTGMPFDLRPDLRSVYQLNGRVLSAEGARIMDRSPLLRLQAMFEDDDSILITENSPLWGSLEASINTDAYFRMELAQLGKVNPGRAYRVLWYHEPSQMGGESLQHVPDNGAARRTDLRLNESLAIPVPEQLSFDAKEGRLSWSVLPQGYEAVVYARHYPDGVYRRLMQTESNSIQISPKDGITTGYIVLAKDKSSGAIGMHSREVYDHPLLDWQDFIDNPKEGFEASHAGIISASIEWTLKRGESRKIRMVRVIGLPDQNLQAIAEKHLTEPFEPYQQANEQLFSKAPPLQNQDADIQHLYHSSWKMMRQVFYPPEAKSSYNYYVFSREPIWGWGHGGQVFHESLTMMAYAWLDPISAMNSQRVYRERQYENGYINYRTGSYLDEIIEFNGQLTSSAPWYAWINWEVYQMTRDKAFLEEMYNSSRRFYDFYISNRDSDGDGLCEWGGHAVLESVRDALVAVWDEVNWPSHFEAVDLNSMLVMEAKTLESMALELGLQDEAAAWRADWEKRAQLIRETFWDEETGFFYHVDKESHKFSHKKQNDLKRMEIIGFLPMWAGIATPEQSERLMQHLTNPDKFWRKYGIPSLAADDPYYNDKGYWNGPVWVEWNYLIQRGLQAYGYEAEALELVNRVAEGMIIQLKRNNNLWEFYSPDDEWAGYHKTYIWAGIINRMLKDVEHLF